MYAHLIQLKFKKNQVLVILAFAVYEMHFYPLIFLEINTGYDVTDT